jgi:hypothetical protein
MHRPASPAIPGADSQDRKPPVSGQITHAVGIIPLALPAQPGHTMRRNAVQQILGKIEPLQIFQPIHQPVSDKEFAGLELSQPYEAGHPIITVSSSNASQLLARIGVMRWAISLDPALGIDQRHRRKGARSSRMSREGSCGCGGTPQRSDGQDPRSTPPPRLPEHPFLQIACAPSPKVREAVDSAKVRQMLVPGLLARGIEDEIVGWSGRAGLR